MIFVLIGGAVAAVQALDGRSVLAGSLVGLIVWALNKAWTRQRKRNAMQAGYVRHFKMTPSRRNDVFRRNSLLMMLRVLESRATQTFEVSCRAYRELDLRDAVRAAVYFHGVLVLQYDGTLAKYLSATDTKEYLRIFQDRGAVTEPPM